MKPLLPAANPSTWLGVMGGGQLGRMFAHAAQSMGYQVAVLEPAAECPAGQVAQRLVQAGYSDAEITEIVSHVALNIFTNYFNHVARTEVDFPKVAVELPEMEHV